MSKAREISNDSPEQPDPTPVIEEHRDLFERIADSDLPVAEYFERAIEFVDAGEEETDE